MVDIKKLLKIKLFTLVNLIHEVSRSDDLKVSLFFGFTSSLPILIAPAVIHFVYTWSPLPLWTLRSNCQPV